MLVGNDGTEIDWLVGYGPPPEEYLEKLENSVKGINTFKSLSDRYAREPKNVEAVLKLAQKWDRRYNEEKALEMFNKVIALDPEGKMGTTEYRDEKVPFTELAEFSIGRLAFYSRKRNAEPLKTFIKKYPESKILKDAYMYMSMNYRTMGSKEEAAKFFEEYVSKYPDDPSVLNSYVTRIIRNKDNIERGIELGEKIKDIMKYNPDSTYMKSLAEVYLLNDDKDKADKAYGKRFMEGRVSQLVYALRDYADFWVHKKTNTESAEEMMDFAVKLKPDSTYILRSAVTIYVKLDKVEKALDIYGPEYIKNHMDKSSTLNSYARFWANLGKNLENALEASKKSVELAPSAYNWDTLSRVYEKSNNYGEALKAQEKAVELAGEQAQRYQSRIGQLKKAMEKEKGKKDKK
ncbi:MAG: tetratricopeptide repeat protein [Candidatus Aminicenantes bacterium]|nr:tetratricopeptide repeat protein [Candidatus Aminicenantes bacterium]